MIDLNVLLFFIADETVARLIEDSPGTIV